ncbi:unnamed protein product [Caenorhabditis auriculariae]|uniref:Small ribosomal subunit protein mS31 n=1 Tax=Caenorhabditis auriculariae TaxID=2777116 RepID=A0A8S1GRX5_9PELO|nr:unnamed protein product [Caenorhabditis auriculariae]
MSRCDKSVGKRNNESEPTALLFHRKTVVRRRKTEKKPQSVKQVLGEDILKAVGDVVDDLHEKGTVENKKLTNKSFGPTNSFEEQIQWTEQGKQWPYPIDNEYLMGEEENVCVGLSKNPYMTAKKKREHLEWFANYFNAEKQKVVEKLHEQEQIAAQNAQ